MRLSAVIITKNEEKNLPRLLSGLAWADEVVVIDDHSTDQTAKIARHYGAKFHEHTRTDFASQRNFGLEQAAGEWILSLDADEELPGDCAGMIRQAIENAGPEVGGFRILRRNIVLGRWLKHGQQFGHRVRWYDWTRIARHGCRPGDYLGGAVKVFRREARFQNAVHEEPEIQGKIIQLQAYVNHYTGGSIQDIFDKNNAYTTTHARMEHEREPRPIAFIPWVLWRPLAVFLRIYIRKLGFMDGLPGLIRALADMNYEFLKNIKRYELSRGTNLDR